MLLQSETEINILPSKYKLCHFNLYVTTLPGKTKNSTKTASRLLQRVLLNRFFQTFAENRSMLAFLFLFVRKFFWLSSNRKSFTFSWVLSKIYLQTPYG